MRIDRAHEISETWIQERFVRASGPGGQNVNRVATAVQLKFNLRDCPDLSDTVKQRLRLIAGTRINRDGWLMIDARRFRTQEANRRDARSRLRDLIRESLIPPKHRIGTRPSRSAVQRRLDNKRFRKEIKRRRSKTFDRSEY